MTGLTKEERHNLEQIACQPGSAFSTCYRFTRPAFRDSLLILQVLLSEISGIPFTVTDPGVARIKIAWWKNELFANLADSQHPLVLNLRRNGMDQSLDFDALNKFFDGIFELADGDPISDSDALLGLSRSIGGSEAVLLSVAGGYIGDQKSIEAIGSAGFIARLLNDVHRQFSNENWWMPMNVRARFGVTGSSPKNSTGLNEAVKWVADLVTKELLEGSTSFQSTANRNSKPDGHHYLKIWSGVIHRRLRKLKRNPASHNVNPSGPGEIMAAWWSAVRHR